MMTGFSFTPFKRVSSRREKKGKGGRERKEKSAQEKKLLFTCCVYFFMFAPCSTDTDIKTVVKHWFDVDLTTGHGQV